MDFNLRETQTTGSHEGRVDPSVWDPMDVGSRMNLIKVSSSEVQPKGPIEPHGGGSKASVTDTVSNKVTDTVTDRVTNNVVNSTNVRSDLGVGIAAAAIGGLPGSRHPGHGGESCDYAVGINALGLIGLNGKAPSKECIEAKQETEVLDWSLRAAKQAEEAMTDAGNKAKSAINESDQGKTREAQVDLDTANGLRRIADTTAAGSADATRKIFGSKADQAGTAGFWSSDILNSHSNAPR